jgi:hypothetical protein
MTTLPDILHISVTRSDIDDGRVSCATRCPVAQAIRRAVPESDYASVSIDCIVVDIPSADGDGTYSRMYQLTEEITDFIYHYDNGHDVAPFEADVAAMPA